MEPHRQLRHGDVRLGFDNLDQIIQMLNQGTLAQGPALLARLRTALLRRSVAPPDRRTRAHRKALRRRPARTTSRHRLNHAKPQIVRSTHAHDPPPMRLNHNPPKMGILRFTLSARRSKPRDSAQSANQIFCAFAPSRESAFCFGTCRDEGQRCRAAMRAMVTMAALAITPPALFDAMIARSASRARSIASAMRDACQVRSAEPI